MQGPPEPDQQPQKSEWREAPVMHLDGAASQPPPGHMQERQLHGTSQVLTRHHLHGIKNQEDVLLIYLEVQHVFCHGVQDDMLEGYLSGNGRNMSIEAMQQGDLRPLGDPAGAAAFASSPSLHPGHPRPRVPASAHMHYQRQHQSFAAGPGLHLERSASAGSKSERGHRGGQRRGWPDGPGYADVAHDTHPGSRTRYNGAAAQQSGVAGERPPNRPGSYGTADEPQLAEAQGQLPPPPPPVFMAPAPPPFCHAAAQHPALLNVQRLLRVLDNNGDLLRQHAAASGPQLPAFPHLPAFPYQPGAAVASQGPAVQLEPLLQQLSQHLSTSWQSRAEPADMDHVGSVRLGGNQGDNMGGEQGGGSNSAAEQYLSGESSEPVARMRASTGGVRAEPSQQQDAGAGYALQTAGSLQRPAEGQLVDPHLQEHHRPASGSLTEEGRWPRQHASAQEATLGPAASWGFARSVQQAAAAEQSVQEAHSLPAQAHHGHAAAGARSGALPALSIIQGQLEDFHPGVLGPRSAKGGSMVDEGRGLHQPPGQGRPSQHAELENAASVGREEAAAQFDGALAAQNSMMTPRQGMPL